MWWKDRYGMKKTAVIILALALVLLAGCGTGESAPDSSAASSGSALVSADVGNASSGAASGSGPNVTEPVGEQPDAAIGQSMAAPAPTGYYFEAAGVAIEMGAPVAPVIEALYEPLNYFEAPSCAFDGVDRIYYYRGFELYTYPVDEVDFVSSVNLTDDSVTTPEGVYLGMTFDQMTGVYGENYSQSFGQYTYAQGDSCLSFLIEDGVIAVIAYNYANLPEG